MLRHAVVILAILALAAPGLARPKRRRRPPKRPKTPAAAVRGTVKEEARPKRPAGEEAERNKAGTSKEKDPRLDTPGRESGPAGGGNPTLQRGQRLEFDGRLVQGQTARSGAVYLFERRRSEMHSMVRERQSYREEIVRTVFPQGGKR